MAYIFQAFRSSAILLRRHEAEKRNQVELNDIGSRQAILPAYKRAKPKS